MLPTLDKPQTNHNQGPNQAFGEGIYVPDSMKSVIPRIPDILAPVGGREQFFAALNAGADAVFLGLKQFNARARAENFSIDDLLSLVPLAHRYNMQVLVTLNILIKDIELEELVTTLASLEDVGVDAIIVQDLGVADLARRFFPGLRLHASTQMAVHNLAGVQKAVEWGFKRVVLARELTAQEIKRIRAAVPKEVIELEVFCHGSLCYSYSGLCFFSGAADARSGNRGECAYTCREPYKILSEPGQGFLFSMKDLDTAHKLNLMVDAGVDTLKIEGRKKDAQYVASVVKLYRKKLNDHFGLNTLRATAPSLARNLLTDTSGTSDFQAQETAIREDLKLSFQRKTTSLFFEGRYHENVIDLDHPSHKGIQIGVIEAVSEQSQNNAWTIQVRLSESLERFDGVKIVHANKVFHAAPQDGERVLVSTQKMASRFGNQEAAFSVREMSTKGRRIFEAFPGMLVDIQSESLSSSLSSLPARGDLVFKTRSTDLRRRIETLTQPPLDERLRPLRKVAAFASLQRLADGGFSLGVSLTFNGALVAESSIVVVECQVRKQGLLQEDVTDVLGLFGDEGVYVSDFSWKISDDDHQLFIPRSRLKQLKKSLQENLEQKCLSVVEGHLALALRELNIQDQALPPSVDPHYEIKIDRVEYLLWIQDLLDSGALSGLIEIVFEPKKMYLGSMNPLEFLLPLQVFSERNFVKIRLALPTVIRAWDEPVLKLWLQSARDLGFSAYEIGNVGALALLENWGLSCADLSSDFMLYGMNRAAVKFWQSQGIQAMCLSIEDDWDDTSALLQHWPQAGELEGILPVAILYKDTPLFVAESCTLTALHNGCPTGKVCGYRSLEIENSKSERFTVAHEGCKSIVYGAKAYSISGERKRLQQAGVSRFRLDFLTRPYAEGDFKRIVHAVVANVMK
ncbi:MAG: U32 family peptidase [Proteobacteria bacterium]|nr:U32 family peptidase [Pseudomonadota bacterium]